MPIRQRYRSSRNKSQKLSFRCVVCLDAPFLKESYPVLLGFTVDTTPCIHDVISTVNSKSVNVGFLRCYHVVIKEILTLYEYSNVVVTPYRHAGED